jgi:hypothetical protein
MFKIDVEKLVSTAKKAGFVGSSLSLLQAIGQAHNRGTSKKGNRNGNDAAPLFARNVICFVENGKKIDGNFKLTRVGFLLSKGKIPNTWKAETEPPTAKPKAKKKRKREPCQIRRKNNR